MQDEQILYNPSQIPAKTWWEMRRLKYNLIVGCIGTIVVVMLNLWMMKGTTFDWQFFVISVTIGIIYALICNLCFTLLWMLDNMNFNNDLVDFHSPKRTFILYTFVVASCLIPFGIMHLVIDLL